MKLGIDPTLRRRLLLLAGLVFTLWASWRVGTDESADKPTAELATPTQKRIVTRAPLAISDLNLDWPSRPDPGKPVADLFSVPLPPVVATQTAIAAVSPPAPPTQTVHVLKLKYMGRLDGIDGSFVFLTDTTGRVISTRVGQTVADEWLFAGMDAQQLVFRHVPTGQEQTISIGATQ